MRYSPMYDWSSAKYWLNFTLWFIVWIAIFYLGFYLKENHDNWLKYLGYFLMIFSVIFSVSNFMSIKNRLMWQKYKYDEKYISQFDPKTFKNKSEKELIDEINRGIKNSAK
ncbi:hypothetical protein [Halpernia sp. GG3]